MEPSEEKITGTHIVPAVVDEAQTGSPTRSMLSAPHRALPGRAGCLHFLDGSQGVRARPGPEKGQQGACVPLSHKLTKFHVSLELSLV